MIDTSCKSYLQKNDVTYTYCINLSTNCIIRHQKLLLLQKIYEKPKVSIQIIKNTKSLNTNNQKCKKEQEQTNERTLIL